MINIITIQPTLKFLINGTQQLRNFSILKSNVNPLIFYKQNVLKSYSTVVSSDNYYDILKVPVSADKAKIKSSFYKLSMKYHPDRNPGNEVAHNEFLKLNEAYSVLSDEERRKDYDRNFLGRPRSQANNFSNRFRTRTSKPVRQYPQNVQFKQGHNFKHTDGSFNQEEYINNHYPEFKENTPFRFNSRFHVNNEPNIEPASAVWGRMTAVVIMMVSCYIIVDTIAHSEKDKLKKGL